MVISLEYQAKECEFYKVGNVQVSYSMYFFKEEVWYYNLEMRIKKFLK